MARNRHTDYDRFDWFYVIGKSHLEYIDVVISTMTTQRFDRFWSEITKVYHNCPPGQCTIFSSYDEAKAVLEEIKNRKSDIAFQNMSVLEAVMFGNDLDVDALKIYALQPVEVTEDDE